MGIVLVNTARGRKCYFISYFKLYLRSCIPVAFYLWIKTTEVVELNKANAKWLQICIVWYLTGKKNNVSCQGLLRYQTYLQDLFQIRAPYWEYSVSRPLECKPATPQASACRSKCPDWAYRHNISRKHYRAHILACTGQVCAVMRDTVCPQYEVPAWWCLSLQLSKGDSC